MELNQRLSERLGTLVTEYGPENQAWFHFVRDHKSYLVRNATKVTFTAEEMVKYRYRPQDFVKEKMSCDISTTWIVMLINDIRDACTFNETKTEFLSITPMVVRDLYRLFSSTANYAYERNSQA